MFGKRISLFTLFGFQVKIDLSWLVLAVLITWSLAQGFFPYYFKGLSSATYWWMGVAGAIGLFFSIIFHEMSHSLVARRYGLPMKGITLFIFGGVAEMEDEPPSPQAELMMALAGPFASLVLVGIFFVLNVVGKAAGWPAPVLGIIYYIWFINGILIVFNLIPGFPLDGGRVLRSILWRAKNNLRWATRVASRVGAGFGTVLIVLGIFSVLFGNFIGGMWYFLIGMFLRAAASGSYQNLLMRQALEGEKVSRFMNRSPVTVPPSITVEQLVENYIYKHHFKMFPVLDGDRLMGCVTIQQVKEIPRAQWKERTVGELGKSCSPDNVISPDEDAMKALAKMNRTRSSRLMVVQDNRLVGIISLKDLLSFFSLKVELEEGSA
jgi:Zn-dependent protease/predicted transcriptional regulator